MLAFLPAPLRGVLAGLTAVVNTLFFAPLLLGVTLLRLLLPWLAWHRWCTAVAVAIAETWISVNSLWMRLTQPLQWDVQGLENLPSREWYLVVANHQSWADILVVQHLFNRRIPMLKFFLKKELIWVPVIGLCWWALDFPFMQRYSQAYLAKHPEKRGKDFEATRKACEKFQYIPVAVFNFLEGTRFTQAKKLQQQSPYHHLLKPKAGGMGFVVGAMGHTLHSMLDITIVYPDLQQPTFWQFLCGRVKHVSVKIENKPIPAEFAGRNYNEDEAFKADFQRWVSQLWQDKDATIVELHQRQIARGWSEPSLPATPD